MAESGPMNLPSELFGKMTFTGETMKTRLPSEIAKKLESTMGSGHPLDPEIADMVAAAVKQWALEHGATHYTHLFQPLTGLTAEKHDAFLKVSDGVALEAFSGDELIQGEPDASSFPSGGIRETFEARGYTAWDASSPMFMRKMRGSVTLCIPTAFVSWTGEALDKKTPLLRSMQALSDQALRILKLFGTDEGVARVITTHRLRAGVLPDRSRQFYSPAPRSANLWPHAARRPPPRGISSTITTSAHPRARHQRSCRGRARLYELGVPVKTRHNEVAPGQYEIAPIFENANVATDHQMLVMETSADGRPTTASLPAARKAVRRRQRLGQAQQLVDVDGHRRQPARSARRDAHQHAVPGLPLRVIRAVDLTPTCCAPQSPAPGTIIASGANEAPPAIISIFLGDMLTDILDQLEKGQTRSDQEGRQARTSARTRCPRSRGTAATATAPARSPSPATSSSSAPSARPLRSPGRTPS
jgi:glutamine synthetase